MYYDAAYAPFRYGECLAFEYSRRMVDFFSLSFGSWHLVLRGISRRFPPLTFSAERVRIGEVKNYNGTVSLTAQIKDDIAFAQQNGYTMVLKVSQSTQLSQPLQQLVTQDAVKLVRF